LGCEGVQTLDPLRRALGSLKGVDDLLQEPIRVGDEVLELLSTCLVVATERFQKRYPLFRGNPRIRREVCRLLWRPGF
jgi:hypothetical protein